MDWLDLAVGANQIVAKTLLYTVMVMSQQWGIELEQGLVSLLDHKRSVESSRITPPLSGFGVLSGSLV